MRLQMMAKGGTQWAVTAPAAARAPRLKACTTGRPAALPAAASAERTLVRIASSSSVVMASACAGAAKLIMRVFYEFKSVIKKVLSIKPFATVHLRLQILQRSAHLSPEKLRHIAPA